MVNFRALLLINHYYFVFLYSYSFERVMRKWQLNAANWCHCLQKLPIGSDMEIMRRHHMRPNVCKTWRKMADLRNGLPIWSCCRISCNNFHTFANYAPQAFFSFTAYLETNRFLPTLNTTIPCYPIYATQALFSFIPHSISAVQA